MSIELVTDFRVLMQLAHNLGKAKKRGIPEEIEKAQQEHDAYKELCLKANKMRLGVYNGDL